jgi:DnaJ-class molecular chaperone
MRVTRLNTGSGKRCQMCEGTGVVATRPRPIDAVLKRPNRAQCPACKGTCLAK